MNKIDLPAIRARVEKATKGKWSVEVADTWEEGENPNLTQSFWVKGPKYLIRDDMSYLREVDAEFIAHAKEDNLDLQAYVEELEKENRFIRQLPTNTHLRRISDLEDHINELEEGISRSFEKNKPLMRENRELREALEWISNCSYVFANDEFHDAVKFAEKILEKHKDPGK